MDSFAQRPYALAAGRWAKSEKKKEGGKKKESKSIKVECPFVLEQHLTDGTHSPAISNLALFLYTAGLFVFV